MAQAEIEESRAFGADDEARLKNSAARLSVFVATFLIALKTATGLLTGSISVWASLLDSAMDIFASTINFYAVRAAARPPDEEHLYGHGKAESLAGLFQAGVITVSGLFLIREAVRRIVMPHAVEMEWLGVGTMAVAGATSLALVARLRRVAHATDSPALTADAAHYATDVYTNGAALVALLFVAVTGWTHADPLISILIFAFILWSAFRVARDSVDVLMDRRFPREIDEAVAGVVSRFHTEGVIGFHDLRTRRSGSVKLIELHLEVTSDQTFLSAHDLTERVIAAIESEIPRSRVQIHGDPDGEDKGKGQRVRGKGRTHASLSPLPFTLSPFFRRSSAPSTLCRLRPRPGVEARRASSVPRRAKAS